MSHEVTRFHDFSMGHRVVGHEGKCKYLHGHNYRVHFTCIGTTLPHGVSLDDVGRVIDFSVINALLCEWLEDNWDHKMILWDQDPVADICSDQFATEEERIFDDSIVLVPFNPTAENIAEYLVEVVGPQQLTLATNNVRLIRVTIDETRKCSATYTASGMRGNIV